MPERHSFECPHCAASNAVELRQAGQSIRCRGCGETIEVPTLRGLRRLREESPRVDAPAPRVRRQTTVAGRLSFVIGFLVTIIGLGTGGVLYYTAAQLKTEPPQAQIDEFNRAMFARMDRQSAAEFWKTWREDVIGLPPGQWRESELAANRASARRRRLVGTGFLAAVPVGVAAMIAALFLRQ